VTAELIETEDDVMEMAASDVLLDPAFTVPAVPGAAAGVGWIRCRVAPAPGRLWPCTWPARNTSDVGYQIRTRVAGSSHSSSVGPTSNAP
jgi:hypothetical protein